MAACGNQFAGNIAPESTAEPRNAPGLVVSAPRDQRRVGVVPCDGKRIAQILIVVTHPLTFIDRADPAVDMSFCSLVKKYQ